MNANNILTANILDIIFEGKNKEYGAYQLRKTYNKRISISLVITVGLITILLSAFVIVNNKTAHDSIQFKIPDTIVETFIPVPPIPLPPPPLIPPKPVATVGYTKPIVVANELVVKPPPDIQDILDNKIDYKTVEGIKNPDYINPPKEILGSQVIAIPVKKRNEDSVFYKVEIDASFPGGASEWTRYVTKKIQINLDEFIEADFGTCIVKFIVDKTGKVSQVEAATMKGTKLAEIAVNAIRKGPDWIPALQNGSYVNAYRLQPVTLNKQD